MTARLPSGASAGPPVSESYLSFDVERRRDVIEYPVVDTVAPTEIVARIEALLAAERATR